MEKREKHKQMTIKEGFIRLTSLGKKQKKQKKLDKIYIENFVSVEIESDDSEFECSNENIGKLFNTKKTDENSKSTELRLTNFATNNGNDKPLASSTPSTKATEKKINKVYVTINKPKNLNLTVEKLSNSSEINNIKNDTVIELRKEKKQKMLSNINELSTSNTSIHNDTTLKLNESISFSPKSKSKIGRFSSPKKSKNINGEKTEHLDSSIAGKNEILNMSYVNAIKELLNIVWESNYGKILKEEKESLDEFFKMPKEYQYACLKLFTWKQRWYNIFQFCSAIKIDKCMEKHELIKMYGCFAEKGFVDTDYTSETTDDLLNYLTNENLKSICNHLNLPKTNIRQTKTKSRSKTNQSSKETLKTRISLYSKNQCTLTKVKSTEEVLRDTIFQCMGKCIRLNRKFENDFNSAYLMGTFANPKFTNLPDFFNIMIDGKKSFPNYPINEYPLLFSDKNDFISYAKARQYRNEMDALFEVNHLKRNYSSLRSVCDKAFEELKNLQTDESDTESFELAPHLKRFTAKSVYVGALSSYSKKLTVKFPSDVQTWLEYLIKHMGDSHRLADWYHALSWIYMRNANDERRHDKAADCLINIFKDGCQMNEIQKHQLFERCRQLMAVKNKKFKIKQMFHDELAQIVDENLDEASFPRVEIDAMAIRSSDQGKKRNYQMQDSSGEKTIMSVEMLALLDYKEKRGYNSGVHCEGGIVVSTFALFFWDIIYSADENVPGTFIVKNQPGPLDMFTEHFYLNRKTKIDKRLKEIASEWSDKEMVEFAENNSRNHEHEYGFSQMSKARSESIDSETLKIIFDCFGRTIMSRIYERLVKNVRIFSSGMPDLMIWNTKTKKGMFVEVKGENDKLSIKQKLWLKYLGEIGANIEVCYVHSIGSKRKKKPTTS